ncbi:MAG TPA: hypothetical protein VIK94_03450 [Bacilli bacterium]
MNMTPEEIKEIIVNSLKPGDTIHITKKSRKPINNHPATFKGAYNHFIMIEALVNDSYLATFTITYSDLFTGDTIIHELLEM